MTSIHIRFNLIALLAVGCGYETAVPFPHDAAVEAAAVVVPPDAPVAADAGEDLAAPADSAADAAPSACASCFAEAVSGGACKAAKPGACEDIPADGVGTARSAGDKALCQALDDCMKMTGCWSGENGPADCFCGTAAKLDCTTAKADGACKAQVMAATKAMTELQAGTLMFSTNVPSGFAAQKYACYKSTCLAACK